MEVTCGGVKSLTQKALTHIEVKCGGDHFFDSKTLTHIEGKCGGDNFFAQKQLPTLRVNAVVVGRQRRKQLPMMVSGTVRLPPPLPWVLFV